RTSNIQHRTLNIDGGDTRPAQRSTFGVQCSVFDVSLSNYERFEIRLPPVAEEPRLHCRRCAHARPRHRGEHRDLQPNQRIVAPAAAGEGAEEADGAGSDRSPRRLFESEYSVSDLSRLPRAKPGVL